MSKQPGWKELAIGGVIPEGGTSEQKDVSGWRTYRPLHSQEKCIHCMRCWIMCPDSSILAEEGKIVGIDYKHCKGCGICARECPDKVQAIDMKLESEIEE
jgi:2-oxoacid:acceptor oxidoreductase delta subunit (pyruvate/2-ketoisovalerate family)